MEVTTDAASLMKVTDAGSIAVDWALRRCESISELITVGIVVRPTQYYVQNGVPALRSANVQENRIDDSEVVFISDEANRLMAKSQVRGGDVVTVRTGYPGTSAVIPVRLSGSNCIDILITRPKREVDPRFLAAWINSSLGKAQVLRNQGGLAQQHFNVGDMRGLLVPLPELSEQRAIAEALSDADALIESLSLLLAKKRQIKQGAMQELLTGKRRLPGFSEAWSEIPLKELFEFKNGLNKAKAFFGYGTPIVNYMDVFSKPVLLAHQLSGRVSVSVEEARNFDVRKGDLFFTRTSETTDEIGLASAMLDEPGSTVFSGFLLRARPRDARLNSRFAAYALRSDHVRVQIVAHASYTTRALTNGRLLGAARLLVPPFGEQEALAGVLEQMDAELLAIEAKRGK